MGSSSAWLASDNSSWGYCRIQGELKKLGHRVAKWTIAKTLKEHGIPHGPERATSRRTFLRAHADAIAATDFFSARVGTAHDLVTHYLLFVIHHATRAVETRPPEQAPVGSPLQASPPTPSPPSWPRSHAT